MRQTLLIMLALAALLPAQATTWQAKTDTIWPARHYRELDGLATGSQRSENYISWNYTEGTVLVYGIHFPTGHVRADAVFRGKSGRKVTFGVRIIHPATGTVVLDTSTTSTQTNTAEQKMEIMPDTEMPYDGWYRFELTCPNGSSTLDRLNLLLFQRSSTLSITDSEIFMAPSVHLWWSTKVPGAPSGQAYNWTYLEVMYPSEYRQPASYQMAIGTDGMYSGIQMPTHSDGSYGHSVLFSVWDNGDTDEDKNLPDYMRSAAVDLGPGAYATRFGGEGTGSSIRYNEDNLWEFDHWIQFLYNVRPDNTTVTTEDGTIIEYESTLQSVWFKMVGDPDWRYIGTLRMSGANRLTSGIYSFLENFSDVGGELMRRCYFRNGAMRSASTGQWYALNHAGYGHTQGKGTRNSRYDYGHGLTNLYENTFYLETGGYMGTRDSADTHTPPLVGEMPWVDTINVERLYKRIDEAVTHNKTKLMQSRIETTRTVSDPATWEVISYSDEETVGEGDNGRAAFIIDGNIVTYYHNRWKTSTVGYPHVFTIEAPEPVTVSLLELYQSRDSNYRAKQMTFYVSDDGAHWTTAGSRLNIEDCENPIIQLPEPVTGRFFRLRFTAGYGSNLVINEVYFKDIYRPESVLDLTRQVLEESDQFDGYSPDDVAALRELYADGTGTDTEAMLQALNQIAIEASPLTYSVLAKAEHFTPFAVYQLHNMNGRGDLIAKADGTISIAASETSSALDEYRQPCSVTNPLCNWLLLRSEKYGDYYLYNLGTKTYLNVAGSNISLSPDPTSLSFSASGKGFVLSTNNKYIGINPSAEMPVILATTANTSSIFQLRTNHTLRLEEEVVQALIKEAERTVHEDNDLGYLFMQGTQTYAKAFVAEPQTDTRLIRSATNISSNANSTQQESHNLAKLVDRNKNTYYETWYNGISWPQEMSYIQTRMTSPVDAFCFSFSPSQNDEYGQPDIPQDIIVSVSTVARNFLPVARIDKDLPQSISEDYISPAIFTDGGSRNIRFQVMRTYGDRANSHIWAMSEFQVHPVIIDEETSPYYQKPVVKEAFDALQEQLQTIRPLIGDNAVTSDDRNALREAIQRAEDALLNGGDGITEIENGEWARDNEATIYDLLGREIPFKALPQRESGKGARIYIIHDGKRARKVIR